MAALLVVGHNSGVLAVDPGDDFAGYMEGLDQRRKGEEAYRERLQAHEVSLDDMRSAAWSSFGRVHSLVLTHRSICYTHTDLETNDVGRLGDPAAPGRWQSFCPIFRGLGRYP